MVDAAFLGGFALWRLRRWIHRKPDTDPLHMLGDSFRHSVFCTGFELRTVENPAMRESETGFATVPSRNQEPPLDHIIGNPVSRIILDSWMN